ncbi:ead/Ea22-like family protein [Enterobacter hormaechei]|uniref:ead/Ea22-like family protein n=1 Tax=Enterobacter hormaechei TaxID=158836 RepID=UPI00388EDCEC
MITEKDNVFYCDCGFSFERGRSGAHSCETGLRKKIAESEAKLAALAAELHAVEAIHNEALFIPDDHYAQCPPEVQKMIRSLAVMQIPAYQSFLAEVRAQAHKEGAYFVANRMLAAWDAGFIDDTAKNAADIARMILTSTEFMADAPEGDFDRSFADGVLEDIAAQLRKGVAS